MHHLTHATYPPIFALELTIYRLTSSSIASHPPRRRRPGCAHDEQRAAAEVPHIRQATHDVRANEETRRAALHESAELVQGCACS